MITINKASFTIPAAYIITPKSARHIFDLSITTHESFVVTMLSIMHCNFTGIE